MKLTLTIVIIALLLIIDQMRTGGYYRTSTFEVIEQAVTSTVRVFSKRAASPHNP